MAYTYQSWQSILSAIKIELGSDVMQLELSDQRIIELIREQVLPEFSSYSGLHKYYKMTEDHIISTDPVLRYQFKDFPYKIMEVINKIDRANYVQYDQMFSQALTSDITDFLVRQNYLDMANMIRPDNTWRFIGPDILEVTKAAMSYTTNDFVLEVEVVHEDPTTIATDMYDRFKDLAIAYIMNAIGKIRKKYNRFNTPFGEINMNADELIQEAKILRDEALDSLRKTPPDQVLFVL